jgi:hypothetical protein
MRTVSMLQIAVIAGILTACLISPGMVAAGPAAQHVTITGWVSCSTCLMPSACKAQSRPSCVQTLVSQGAYYILVAGNHRYKLSGDEKDLAKAAGENSVIVTGDLDGNELTVASIEWKGKQSGKQ